MAPAIKRGERDEAPAGRWRPLIEALFWSGLLAAGVVFALRVYLPNERAEQAAQERLRAVEAELAEREATLERQREFIRDLTSTTVDPGTVERELRVRYGWRKDGETDVQENAGTD